MAVRVAARPKRKSGASVGGSFSDWKGRCEQSVNNLLPNLGMAILPIRPGSWPPKRPFASCPNRCIDVEPKASQRPRTG